jgi:hypothetical protein
VYKAAAAAVKPPGVWARTDEAGGLHPWMVQCADAAAKLALALTGHRSKVTLAGRNRKQSTAGQRPSSRSKAQGEVGSGQIRVKSLEVRKKQSYPGGNPCEL